MFKPGDKVVAVENTLVKGLLEPGKIYTVKKVNDGGKRVVIEGMYEDGSEPIEGLPATQFMLEKGWNKPKKVKNTIDNNPKTAVALSKPRLSDVPPAALFALGAAMSDGANKYGRFNWRETSVTASVFYDAMMRHLTAWYNGEDHAKDSKVHHLGHIMAGCAILLDAPIHNVFNDDRNKAKPESVAENKQYWMDTSAEI